MKKLRKLFAIVLTLIMAVSACPVSAHASDIVISADGDWE